MVLAIQMQKNAVLSTKSLWEYLMGTCKITSEALYGIPNNTGHPVVLLYHLHLVIAAYPSLFKALQTW